MGALVKRLLVMVVVILASQVLAQQPTVTPHPVDVMTRDVTPAQIETLQKEYRRLLSLAQVTMPPRATLTSAMAELKRQDCATSDDCLRRLAVLGGTLYALYVTAVRDPDGSTTLTGRVVRDDGKLALGPIVKKEFRKGTEGADATMVRALNALIAEARLGQLSPSREAMTVVTTPVEKADAGVAVALVESADAGVAWTAPPPPPLEPSPLKTAGTVTLVTGGGVALLGAILLGAGANEASTLNVQGGAVAREQAERAVTANTLQGLGTGLLIAGGVGAAAGLVMRMVAPEAPVSKVSISAAPVPGGASVVIGGAL
jgi:hypothetical protein